MSPRLPVHPRDAHAVSSTQVVGTSQDLNMRHLALLSHRSAPVFAGTQDLIREVVTHLAREPVHERRSVGHALMLTSKAFYYDGARLLWHDLQDCPDLAPLFLLLDRVSFSDGLHKKLARPGTSLLYVYFTLSYAPPRDNREGTIQLPRAVSARASGERTLE